MARTLVVSRHVSLVQLADDVFLCGHAFRGPRDLIDAGSRAHLEAFREPRDAEAYVASQPADHRDVVSAKLAVWLRQGLLVDATGDEDAQLQREFGSHVEIVRDGVRRTQMRARHDPRVRGRITPAAIVPAAIDAWKVVYLGLCLVLPSADVLAELAAEHGCDVHAIGTFPADLALIDEEKPDFVVVGDLPRLGLGYRDAQPVQYVDAVRQLVSEIRQRTTAPILVRNLPGPTCSLGGLADRGADSHVNRVRAINIGIAALVDEIADVHVVDIDQALALAGRSGLVDDMVVLSHHLGSLTWLAERAARDPVPGSAYDASELLRSIDVPRERLEAEYLLAGEDLRVMLAVRGVGRRKVIVVDLDEILWPGVLAETGAPFPPNLPVDVHPHHLYLGLHEALLALRDRGILLACVSKNDEAVVRELWRYPPTFANSAVLTLDDFVTHRINWNDKVENVISIAEELDVAIETFAFIDDNPHERERVRARLPGVMVLGDNPFGVRWQLLTHPAFQVPHLTDESRRRSAMVRGQLARERSRIVTPDPGAFAASLGMRCTIRRETDEAHLARVVELVHRTTQLTTTGEKPSTVQLRACTIYTVAAADRFADYGIVGAVIADGGVIRQLVVSCRVIGLGLDQLLLRAAVTDIARRMSAPRIVGRLIATARNHPARHVFATAGFTRDPDDETRWSIDAGTPAAPTELPYSVTYDGFD